MPARHAPALTSGFLAPRSHLVAKALLARVLVKAVAGLAGHHADVARQQRVHAIVALAAVAVAGASHAVIKLY
jgi:hypothetical protein